jgi:hypothetical protein
MIHHIAIGTRNVSVLGEFYLKLPDSEKIREEFLENKEGLRSIWIRQGETILMIENGEAQGPRALVVRFQNKDRKFWENWFFEVDLKQKTAFTYYFSDPDGNLLGVSAYPEVLTLEVRR